jgi:transcriptional regulator with XRE-family HTH domain
MTEVVDNVKVGSFIKSLLKENKMTQEDLANELNISRSAVSQNLNGKSAFDMENMVKIAKLFSLSLDSLLNCRKEDPNNETFDSQYLKFLSRGLDELKKYSIKDLVVQEPDAFGKLFIDYIIENQELEIFNYLNDNSAVFVREYYHRAKEIYLSIIYFMLENNLEGVIEYIKKYATLNGSFLIHDEEASEKIWKILDQEKFKNLIYDLMDLTIKHNQNFLVFKRQRTVKAMTRDLWIKAIANHKLKLILDLYIEKIAKPSDLLKLTKTFLTADYEKGIDKYLKAIFDLKYEPVYKRAFHFQTTVLLVLQNDNYKLFKRFIELEIYEDMTSIIQKTISDNLNKYYEFLLTKANINKENINFTKIAETAIQTNKLDLILKFKNKLTQDELNYLISTIDEPDNKALNFLIGLGAKFTEKYYRKNTFENVNTLINCLKQKEGVEDDRND